MLQSLKDKLQSLNNNGIEFMDGREKAEELPTGSEVTIDDYGFINGEDGQYVVLSLKEHPTKFFFGGSVVTAKMQELDQLLSEKEKEQLRDEGVPVLFTKRNNKKGKRTYMACEFYPVF